MTIEPCPLCCCEDLPLVRMVGDWKDLFVVECPGCGYTAAEPHEASTTPRGAIRLWNRRSRRSRIPFCCVGCKHAKNNKCQKKNWCWVFRIIRVFQPERWVPKENGDA